MWYDLEKVESTNQVSRNGLLLFGSSGTGETAEGSILGAIDTMRTVGIEHEVVDSSEELCRRYEGL